MAAYNSASSAYDSASTAFAQLNSVPGVSRTVTTFTWLVRANLIIQVVVTVVALAWGAMYTSMLRKADPQGHEVFILRAMNDLWFGTRSGIAITLASEWSKTIIIIALFAMARRMTPATIKAFAHQVLKE